MWKETNGYLAVEGKYYRESNEHGTIKHIIYGVMDRFIEWQRGARIQPGNFETDKLIVWSIVPWKSIQNVL